MRAVVITQHGPPETLQVQQRQDPQPGPEAQAFGFDRSPDAHRFISERRNVGKVLLVP